MEISNFLINSYGKYLAVALFFVGSLLILGYFFDFYRLIPFRRKKPAGIEKYIKDYVDADGNLLLERLAEIWLRVEKKNLYTRKEVVSLVDKAAVRAKKEMAQRAESVLGQIYSISDVESSDEIFSKLPAEEKIAALFGEDFIEEIAGEDISPEAKSRLADYIWNYVESFKDRKLSDFSREEIREIVSELKKELKGERVNNLSSKRASVIVNEVAEEVLKENIPHVVSSAKGPGELKIDETFEGNLSADVKERLVELGMNQEIVERIYVSPDEMLSRSGEFEYLWRDSVGDLIKFYNQLYLSKDLRYFLSYSFEPVKLFKDYMLYLLDNYRPGDKSSSVEGFGRVIGSAEFYNYLSLKNYKSFKKKKDAESKNFTFMSIIVAYESFTSENYQKNHLDLMETLFSYLNVKREGVAYREFVFSSNKGKEEEQFVVSYDHVGFTYDGEVYLIPKALDIIMGKYFLAVPYLFKNHFEMFFLSDYFPHVGLFKVKRKVNGDFERRNELLIKVRKDSNFYASLMENLKHKDLKISNYRNLHSIELVR